MWTLSRPFVLGAVFFSLVAAPPAQTVVRELLAPIDIVASACSRWDSRSIQPHVITAGRYEEANVGCGLLPGGATASARLTPTSDGVDWVTETWGRSPGSVATASGGTIRLSTPGSSVGSVVVRSIGSQVSGRSTFWIDVGADGTRELDQPFMTVSRTFRVCSPRDLVVSFGVNGITTEFDNARLDLSVSLVPGLAVAAVTPYGPACGADLVVTDQPIGANHQLTLALSQGFPNGLGGFVFGIGRAQIPVQGCLLLTQPIAVFPVATPQGSASLQLPLPGPLSNFAFHAQGIAVDAALNLRTSSGSEIALGDC